MSPPHAHGSPAYVQWTNLLATAEHRLAVFASSMVLVFLLSTVTFVVSPADGATRSLCGGHPATLVGSLADDVLQGTPGRDVIVGLNGDDRIHPGTGNDVVCGNGGSDVLVGGPGDDKLSGGNGDDRIVDGRGDDVDVGGLGSDRFTSAIRTDPECPCGYIDVWDDRIEGGSGRDELRIFGGHTDLSSRTYILGTSDDEVDGVEDVSSGAYFGGAETIVGDIGRNVLDGAAGHDVIVGRGGNDVINTGAVVAGGAESGRIIGGPGEDRLALGAPGDINLSTGRAHYAEDGALRLKGIEDASAAFGSELIGDSKANNLVGSRERDVLRGRGGADGIVGRSGEDRLNGGPGNDVIVGGPGTDVCRRGEAVVACEAS